MNTSDILSLIITVDELVFSHRGEHLDDIEQAILKGVFEHQKYAEIAKQSKRSEKYIKYVASRLWKALSRALGEEVTKANVQSNLQRHYYNFANNQLVNFVSINQDYISNQLPYREYSSSYNNRQQAKLETVSELMREGLSLEQIARALKLPLELVQSQIETAD